MRSFRRRPEFLHAIYGPLIWADELLDLVDSKAYWQLAGVKPSAENLIPLAAQEKAAVDAARLEALVVDLGSPNFAKRQKAMNALAEAGSASRPFLEKAQRSGDPGLAAAAGTFLSKITREIEETKRHQLMAIRSLGELKAVEAAPHLKNLLGSDEPFVGEYAARSLAQIRGEKWTPKQPDPDAFATQTFLSFDDPICLGISHGSVTVSLFPRLSPTSS